MNLRKRGQIERLSVPNYADVLLAGYFTAPRITPPTTHFWAKM